MYIIMYIIFEREIIFLIVELLKLYFTIHLMFTQKSYAHDTRYLEFNVMECMCMCVLCVCVYTHIHHIESILIRCAKHVHTSRSVNYKYNGNYYS